MDASTSTREVFIEAVRAVLSTWPVLQIAVDNGFGGAYGQQKAEWMIDVVGKYFYENSDLVPSEVEDYVSVLVDQEFNTVVDDGSLTQISQQLCALFSDCQRGAVERVQQTIAALAQKNSGRARVTVPPSSDESDEEVEDMESDAPSSSSQAPASSPPRSSSPTAMTEEEDGWTTVRKKK